MHADDVTEQMAEYIREHRSDFPEAALRANLLKDGYDPAQVDAAFRLAGGGEGAEPGRGRRLWRYWLRGALIGAAVGAVIGGAKGLLAARLDPERERQTRSSLVSLRSAVAIRFGVSNGVHPATLESLTPGFVRELPAAYTGRHGDAAGETAYGAEACAGGAADPPRAEALKDGGGWGYVGDSGASCRGQVFVDCTHRDSRGKEWYKY